MPRRHNVLLAEPRGLTGETWQVWADDAYSAVCELAGQVGVDLADG